MASENHNADGLVATELTHCGYFSRHESNLGPQGRSASFTAYGFVSGLGWVGAMTKFGIADTVDALGFTAELAIESGRGVLALVRSLSYTNYVQAMSIQSIEKAAVAALSV